MSNTIRILVADDHSVVRAGLRALLEHHDNFRVVAEAATGEDAVTKAMELRPDSAVLDIRMPGLSGIAACRQIVEKSRLIPYQIRMDFNALFFKVS
jgi:two-component system, NarL family, response regulator DevR